MTSSKLTELKGVIQKANSIAEFEQSLNEDFIQLHHVLVAIHKKDLAGIHAISSAGIFFRLLDRKLDKYEKWDFFKDNLLEQSSETIDFLYNLLVKE